MNNFFAALAADAGESELGVFDFYLIGNGFYLGSANGDDSGLHSYPFQSGSVGVKGSTVREHLKFSPGPSGLTEGNVQTSFSDIGEIAPGPLD